MLLFLVEVQTVELAPYGLTQKECCELTRVALTKHKAFVSEILAKAIKFLRNQSPNIQLIISYADAEQNHHGGIYQATNWIYEGKQMENITSLLTVRKLIQNPFILNMVKVVKGWNG